MSNERTAPHDLPGEEDALQRISRGFRWISQIEAPDAPGFCFFGGEVHAADFGHPQASLPVASLSGKGIAGHPAFEACVGEGIEHLSRLEWGDEGLTEGPSDEFLHGLDAPARDALWYLLRPERDTCDAPIAWMSAARLSDGAACLVPADLCLRRAHVTPPSAISTGCAAGPTQEAATLAALLELVERDAAALWWRGGRAPRLLSLETLARADAAGFISQLRGDADNRASWLLDITSELDIPVIAAVSFDREGRGFASGLAARLDPAEAIRAALLELCQIELGHHIVDAKRQVRGDAALNDADRRKLRRSQTIDAQTCMQLQPVGPPSRHRDAGPVGAAAGIDRIVAKLQAVAVEPLVVDLTHPALGVPVVRALAPGLQPFPSTVTTARLGAEMKRNRIREDDGHIPLF